MWRVLDNKGRGRFSETSKKSALALSDMGQNKTKGRHLCKKMGREKVLNKIQVHSTRVKHTECEASKILTVIEEQSQRP